MEKKHYLKLINKKTLGLFEYDPRNSNLGWYLLKSWTGKVDLVEFEKLTHPEKFQMPLL